MHDQPGMANSEIDVPLANPRGSHSAPSFVLNHFEALRRTILWFALAVASVVGTNRASADSHWNTIVPYTCGSRLTKTEPTEYGVLYTRLIRLEHSGAANGRLIAIYEHFPNPFVIFRSTDEGISWQIIGQTPRGHMPAPWTFEGEPHLYELPSPTGNLPVGTILIAGSTVRTHPDGTHLSQRLEVYASTDHGITWTYRGVADEADGLHGGIWEPNIFLAKNGNLVMVYSDERQMPKFSQVLAMRESKDAGISWGPEKNVVAVPDGKQRPGMAVTQKLPSGKYVMSYEWINGEDNPAYIRFSEDGLNWGDPVQRGIPAKTANGSCLGGTPYCLWIPVGGPKGALIVNARELTHSPNADREIFVNFNMGEGPWVAMASPVQWQGNQEFDGWSMGMIPSADGKGIILMAPSYAGKDCNEVLIGRCPILVPGLNYRIVNSSSGLSLAIPNDSKVHGTLLNQAASSNIAGQIWSLKDLGDEWFALTNPSSGLTVDDYQLKIRNGSPLAVWDSNLLPFQQWKPIPTAMGDFKLLNRHANRLLSVLGGSNEQNASIVLWDDDGTSNSKWKIVPME